MIRSRVFLNNGTQAVRLPKEIALNADVRQVTVGAEGRALVGECWGTWFNEPGVTPDFLAERDQPAMQEREAIRSPR